MAGTVISAAVRNNLAALQSTASQQALVQNRLATGKKVNSALDNPANFFTAQSLNRRATDLSSLLDGMSNGIKTLDAASNATTSISKSIESLKANIRSARSDKSFQGQSFAIDATTIGTSTVKNLSFLGGSVGSTAVNVAVNTVSASATPATLTGSSAFAADTNVQALAGKRLTLTAGSNSVDFDITASTTKAQLTTALTASGFAAAFDSSDKLKITRADGANITASGTAATVFGISGPSTDGVAAVTGAVKTVDQLVSDINSNTSLKTAIRASNDSGKLRIENLSASDTDLKVTGVGTNGIDGSTGTTAERTIGGNENRKALVKQFNEVRQQIDKTADDASFNGINLLKADKLKLTFNETGTSSIEVQAKDSKDNVRGISTAANSLNIDEATNDEFSDDTKLDTRLDGLSKSLTTLQTQSSAFGSALTTIQTRQDFTKSMINTLQAGADTLVNADLNEESATLLALNTRQQLSQTALQLASQADQAVLRLF